MPRNRTLTVTLTPIELQVLNDALDAYADALSDYDQSDLDNLDEIEAALDSVGIKLS